MSRITWALAAISLLMSLNMLAQSGQLKGKVTAITDGKTQELAGANIFWKGTQTGTVSDQNGAFSLPLLETTDSLVISFVGYTDRVLGPKDWQVKNLIVELQASEQLAEVEIVKRQKSTRIERMSALKTEQIVQKELLKAACCNLSESFETSPSVDVSFTDAITGTRQIQMLGLAGVYSQMTRENIPAIRALSSINGLTYVPGTWLHSIQLNKGAGSVVNGFESITGQINYELQKPLDTDPFFLNLYANQGGRLEFNAHGTTAINDKIGTAVLLHGKSVQQENDRNSDGFLDMPTGENLVVMNRWFFMGRNGWRYQAGAKYSNIETLGGQINRNEQGSLWTYEDKTDQLMFFAKGGKVFDLPWKSLGIQAQYVMQQQEVLAGFSGFETLNESRFFVNGLSRNYDASQHSFYTNFIYQSIIGNTNNTFKTGFSFQGDVIDEKLNNNLYQREELVPGVFFESSKTWSEKFKTVAGLRADYHSNYGAFITPRFHGWWAPSEEHTLRFSAGRGLRTANIFAENFGQWSSLRSFRILGDPNSNNPYGLSPEIAWNYGANYTHYTHLWGRDAQVALDFYRTDFVDQIIVDRDIDDNSVFIYNLTGRSFANSVQAQVDYELFERFDLRLAYRWYDVKSTFNNSLQRKPFLANHRAFVNASYETKSKWFLDATVNWQGSKRIPFSEQAPSFFLLNTQVRKVFSEKFEAYIGVENLLNFTQANPILIDDRRGAGGAGFNSFDAASVWGPIFGRNIYAGLRYRILK